MRQDPTPRLGISSCLLGEKVRYNGGHKRDRLIMDLLGPFVEWIPVCPEIEVGMGAPRETIRLVGNPEDPQLIAPSSGKDWTQAMREWSEKRVQELKQMELHGYILKRSSPSCGLFRVKVYNEKGMPGGMGRGLFATTLVGELELLPVEEEGRLHDPLLRENFVSRIFAFYRWRQLMNQGFSAGALVRFHTAYKLMLLAHSPRLYRELGRLVASGGTSQTGSLSAQYVGKFMTALGRPATRKRHVNVLQHLLGFLRDCLSPEDRLELREIMEDYRQGLVPRIVPITLFRHHFRRQTVPDWVHEQVYLNPYPKEMMLMNNT